MSITFGLLNSLAVRYLGRTCCGTAVFRSMVMPYSGNSSKGRGRGGNRQGHNRRDTNRPSQAQRFNLVNFYGVFNLQANAPFTEMLRGYLEEFDDLGEELADLARALETLRASGSDTVAPSFKISRCAKSVNIQFQREFAGELLDILSEAGDLPSPLYALSEQFQNQGVVVSQSPVEECDDGDEFGEEGAVEPAASAPVGDTTE